MLNAIIRFSIRNKLIIGLFIAGLIGYGAYSVSKLPIDALPDITSNQVQVITVTPTLAAPEVERLISFTIEQSTANIPGISEMRSISRFGLSVVTIVFDDDIDMYWARQQVAERLTSIKEQIPVSAGIPQMAPPTTGLGEIFQYIIKPQKGYEDKIDLTELRSIQDWIVRRQLLGIPGVADVSSFGGKLKQYEVAVMPDRLKSMDLTLADVFAALEKNNQNSGGGYIERNSTALFIRTEGLAMNLDDIRSIYIKSTHSGLPIYLRDIAEVRFGHAVRYGAMVDADKGEVAGAVVLMLKGANASQVVKDVKTRMAIIEKTLPEGVAIETFYDRTKMVDNALGTVKKNLLEGALIVVFILVLFLGNFRAGLIVASVIPLAMLFAVIMMNIFGVSGNLMSLGALDFGLIVDGAVIIVEAVMHRLYHTKSFASVRTITQDEMNTEVEQASSKMMNAAVFGQIIILIVYLPILTLVGIEGKMFKPMAQTVSFALIGAFLLSVTYVPMITSLVLGKKLNHAPTVSDRIMNKLVSWYQPVLKNVLAFPRWLVIGSVALFGLAVFFMTRLGGEFIPELEEGDFAVDTRVLVGSSLTTSIEVSQKGAGLLLKKFPEIEKIVTRIGAGEIPTDPMPIEMGDMIILLKPKKEWTSADNYDDLATKMSAELSAIPGLTAGFQFPVQMRFNELISGARQDVVCKIFGEDLDSLAVFAQRLSGVVRRVEGATDLYVETVTGLPQIVVNYNRSAIARYRLQIEDINTLIRTSFAGESAGLIYENERRFDLVVRLSEEGRTAIKDIEQLLIPTPSGTQIPLYQVATVEVKDGPNQIQREDAKRRIVVGFNVRGADVESVVKELEEKVKKELVLPAGYYIHYGGQFENLQHAKARLSIAVPVALLLILLLLYFSFGSIKYGLLIFSAIPLSAIGGVFALFIRSMPFSISAGIGFIALFGVAVLNGIVLIAEFNRLKKEGETNLQTIVMEGTSLRLRPVLMTAAVASLGFLPMALSHGPGAEVQRPLATVVIGGLFTATLLTLLLLPVLYVWLERRTGRLKLNPLPVLLFFVGMLTGTVAHAQTKELRTVSVDSLLAMVERQSLDIKAAEKQEVYWKTLESGTFELSKTQLGVEYGRFNSVFSDNRLFVNQGLQLPAVYKRQKELYQEQGQLQKRITGMHRSELRKEVRILFVQLIDLKEREKLVRSLDSIYSRFSNAASLRLEAGESNQLEKTTADALVDQLRLQLKQLDFDRTIVQQRLMSLTNSEILFEPLYEDPMLVIQMESVISDSSPGIQVLEQQAQVAVATGKVERTQLLPEFTVGYTNMSIVGYQTKNGVDDLYFGPGYRFHSVNFTLGLPLFMKATRTRVKASQVQAEQASMQADALRQTIQYRQMALHQQIKKYEEQIRYFQSGGRRQAEALELQAREAYREGEIDYLQWTQLMNQVIAIRLNYLDALKAYNTQQVDIFYLTGK
jgi:cobalt-zinc-cadmium resistance protein CzcA